MEEAADIVYPETNADDGDEVVANFDLENIDHIVTPNDEAVEYETDFLDSDLSGLDTGDCNYNWNSKKDISLMAVLNDYTKEYYTSRQSKYTNEDEFHALDQNVYIYQKTAKETLRIFLYLSTYLYITNGTI